MEAAPAANPVETRESSSSSAAASSASSAPQTQPSATAAATTNDPATTTTSEPDASTTTITTIGNHPKTMTTTPPPATNNVTKADNNNNNNDNDIRDDSVYQEPPGLYDTEHTEWESTITIMSNETTYNRIAADPETKTDTVVLWADGTRLASRRLERKVNESSKNLLIFYNDRWVPLVRTTAQEALVDVYPPDKYQQITYRSVVYPQKGIRVTHNKTATDDGLRYTIEYEIEYPPGTLYADIVEHERRLLQCFVERAAIDGHDADPVRTLPPMEMAHMFECVMSRLQLWNCFDDRLPYAWAYKWNGIKAKILLAKPYDPSTEKPGQTETAVQVSYWTDDCIIGQRSLRVPTHSARAILGLLTNVCCAVEVLEDRIVLLEAIGTRVAKLMHTAEPQTNRAFLDAMGDLVSDAVRRSGGRADCITLGERRLQIQRYYDAPRASRYDPNCHDGFVLMQTINNEGFLIRWKFPTTDVKCVVNPSARVLRRSANGSIRPALSRYYCAGDGSILALNTEGEPGGIYEIDPEFKILRKRTDRLAASSASEYETFLASCRLIPNLVPPQH